MAQKFLKTDLKTNAQLIARVSLWLVSLMIYLYVSAFTTYLNDSAEGMWQLLVLRITGILALCQLVICLSITPLSHFFSSVLKASRCYHIRRESGIQAGLLAIVHGVYSLQTYLSWQWWLAWHQTWLFSGFIALIILAVMLFSSPDAIRRKMNGAIWKALHQSLYPAMILISIHFMLAKHGDPMTKIGFVFVIALLLIWRLIRAGLQRKNSAKASMTK